MIIVVLQCCVTFKSFRSLEILQQKPNKLLSTMLLVEKLDEVMAEATFWYLMKSYSSLIEQEAIDSRNVPGYARCMHGAINKHICVRKIKKGK